MHELGSIYSLTKHKRHFSTTVGKPDCCASDLGSIPGQVNILENFILLNSSKIRWELWKISIVDYSKRQTSDIKYYFQERFPFSRWHSSHNCCTALVQVYIVLKH